MSAFAYGQVLMDSDDEGHELNPDRGPDSQSDYHSGDTDGHLFARSQTTTNVGVTAANTGALGAALQARSSRPRDYTETLQGEELVLVSCLSVSGGRGFGLRRVGCWPQRFRWMFLLTILNEWSCGRDSGISSTVTGFWLATWISGLLGTPSEGV